MNESTTPHPDTVSVPATATTNFEFAVVQNADGSPYLTITQTHSAPIEIARQQLIITKESFQPFHDAYTKATKQMLGQHKAYSLDEKRTEHAHAYTKWTPEDDSELTLQYGAGKSIDELAESFGRNTGAIRSRLSKLGLIPLHKAT